MRSNRHTSSLRISTSQGFQLLFLCGFFALGSVLGHIIAQVSGFDGQLQAIFLSLVNNTPDSFSPALWSVLFRYFRFPLLALLIGYCSFTIVAIPLLMLALGCIFSFSVSSLSVSLGTAGIPLALASFGLRCIIVIVCTLVLALWSFKRSLGCNEEKTHLIALVGICFVLLMLGVILELTVTPILCSSALSVLQP